MTERAGRETRSLGPDAANAVADPQAADERVPILVGAPRRAAPLLA
jgi:hypothetical protein